MAQNDQVIASNHDDGPNMFVHALQPVPGTG
jgi:hypothetical protein